MSLRRAVFLDLLPLDQNDLDLSPLHQAFDELVCHEQTTPEQVIERLQGAQAVISNKVRLSAEAIAACPELKLILVAATGYNNVDIAAARARHHRLQLPGLRHRDSSPTHPDAAAGPGDPLA